MGLYKLMSDVTVRPSFNYSLWSGHQTLTISHPGQMGSRLMCWENKESFMFTLQLHQCGIP